MKMQRGQAMTEYLVALGIGGSIIAALTLAPCEPAGTSRGCVPALIDALHNNYEGYSAAIGAVQDYEDIAVADPPSGDGSTSDDQDTATGGDQVADTPTQAEALNKVNYVYDANGNVVGTVVGDVIYDADGNAIGTYTYNEETGEQTATINGEVISGVSTGSVFVDDEGNEVALKAFVVNGKVVGFGYEVNGEYYEPLQGELTEDVPDDAVVTDTRPVRVYDSSGNSSVFGYEVDGYVYSLAQVQVAGETYESVKTPDGELVQMTLSQPLNIVAWAGYSTCIVRSYDWVNSELTGYPGSGAYVFDKTEDDGSGNEVTTANNAIVESPTNNLGYIDSDDLGSGGCDPRWKLVEGTDNWTLSGPY